ncbi:hypothetical protein HBB16_16430 [Pseudonocardia sp. MCCB 268]|nr:hypothetical protein [Pseudonocardia cytotoxica]
MQRIAATQAGVRTRPHPALGYELLGLRADVGAALARPDHCRWTASGAGASSAGWWVLTSRSGG